MAEVAKNLWVLTNEVRKDLPRLATVTVGSLSGRSREVVDMFKKEQGRMSIRS